jgi:hypothetical protein
MNSIVVFVGESGSLGGVSRLVLVYSLENRLVLDTRDWK